MKLRGHSLLPLLLTVLLICGVASALFSHASSHFVPIAGPKLAWYLRGWHWARMLLTPPKEVTLRLSGTPGTPVVVGFEIDKAQSGMVQLTIPTDFRVRARRYVYCSIKNVGVTNATVTALFPPTGDGTSQSLPPHYGIWVERDASPDFGGVYSGSLLTPTDWPEILPTGMTRKEALRRDFVREFYEAEIRHLKGVITRDGRTQRLSYEIAYHYQQMGDYPAAASAYEEALVIDSTDCVLMHAAASCYVDVGGTNLDLAYEVTLKARALDHQEAHVNYVDTLGWIQLKRGYYDEAVDYLESAVNARGRFPEPTVSFHLGMAYYMRLEEKSARAMFERVVRFKGDTPEAREAKTCLELLAISAKGPNTRLTAKLKARLDQVPDDPVALDRLGATFEKFDDTHHDLLIAKASGLSAYRRGEFTRAAQLLAEASEGRSDDPELLFHLGMSLHRIGREVGCAESLRKALSLGLKAAHAEEANRVLRIPPPR